MSYTTRRHSPLGGITDVAAAAAAVVGDPCLPQVATLVLREQGIRCRPLACQLMVGNAEWARICVTFLEQHGRWPTQEEWTDGMWAVGIGYGPDPRATRPGYSEPRSRRKRSRRRRAPPLKTVA